MVKRFFAALVLATAVAGGASADWYNSFAPGIDESKVLINAGVGYGFSSYSMGIPPISVSADFKLPVGIPLTVGVTGAFSTWGYELWNTSVTYTNIAIGGRAHWHFGFVKNLDTYIGLTLGYVIQTSDNEYYSGAGFFLYGGNIGLRYFFTNNIGAYLEIGYSGLQIASIGLSLKF